MGKQKRSFVEVSVSLTTVLVIVAKALAAFLFQKVFGIIWDRFRLDRYLDRFRYRKKDDNQPR